MEKYNNEISENIKRYRYLSKLTQSQLAEMSGVSLPTIKKIEGGKPGAKFTTVKALADAMNVDVKCIIKPAVRLRTIRFRSCKNMRSKEGVVSYIVNKLEKYNHLEELSKSYLPENFKKLEGYGDPVEKATACRKFLQMDDISPVANITHATAALGIKLFNVSVDTEKFFGLSVGAVDGGPAIIVNGNKKITYEQALFAVAHELGHLMLHQETRKELNNDIIWAEEDEADLFAGHFLMPQKGFEMHWEACRGLHWTDRVIKVKHIYGVHYKTILHRLGDFKKLLDLFIEQYNHGSMKDGRDPLSVQKNVYIEERFYRLAVKAAAVGKITADDGADMLEIQPDEMRRLMDSDMIIKV